jgi:hypothetical protein
MRDTWHSIDAAQIHEEIAVTISLTSLPIRAAETGQRRHSRSRSRRELAERDRHSARLAELVAIRALLEQASALVLSGWVQHCWFARTDGSGRRHIIDARNLHALPDEAVTGVCLVGAVVHAAGGPRTASSQLVQRTLDLTWHTLYRPHSEPVHWCPAPSVRAAQLRDLTRFNDHPRRTAAQVAALLSAASKVGGVQIERRGKGSRDPRLI